ETDTEIIVQLVEYFSDKGLSTEAAFTKVVSLLEGSYALGLIDSQDRDTMYVAKNKSPLLIGVGDGFNVIASDALAMLQVTNQYKEIHDHEIVIVKRDEVVIKDQEGNIQNREAYTAQIDAADAEKGVYDEYMLKEIHDHGIVMVKREEGVMNDQEGNIQNREAYTARIDAADAEKGVYDHYMLKEIQEQPAVMRRIIQEYQDDEGSLRMDADITRD